MLYIRGTKKLTLMMMFFFFTRWRCKDVRTLHSNIILVFLNCQENSVSWRVCQRNKLNLGKSSKMVIFVSFLITFIVSNHFWGAAWSLPEINYSLKPSHHSHWELVQLCDKHSLSTLLNPYFKRHLLSSFHLMSISSIFYMRLLHRYLWAKKLQSQKVTREH
jgi:hypothetical protein